LNITFPLGQNAFRNYLPDSVVSNKSTIQRLVEHFRETGSIGEKRRSGRPCVLSNDILEDIRARLLQSPRKSLRKLSQQTETVMKLGLLIVLYPMGCVIFGSLCISIPEFQSVRPFCDLAPCSLVGVDRRFRGAYCLHHQGYE
jgi:hypothetical protein